MDVQLDWAAMLEEARQRFGAAPRDFGDAEKQHIRVAFSWLTRIVSWSDGLCKPLGAQRKVFRDGTVVWGSVIQANSGLFQSGRVDLPGEVVYSLSKPDVAPEELARIAEDLGQLKGTKPTDAAMAGIADYLTDEFIRVFGLPVPKLISSQPCCISTVQFARHHLPNQMLSDRTLPLVVANQAPHYAFVLPAVYWPQQLLEQWCVKRPRIGSR